MDPRTLVLMMGASGIAKQVGAVSWQGSNDSSVTLGNEGLTYGVSGNSDGNQTYSNVLPGVTSVGCYLDVNLATGYPGTVAWLGVCNTVVEFSSGSSGAFAGWYWSGAIWYPGGQTSADLTLTSGDYRLALKSSASGVDIYFKKAGNSLIRGPIVAPAGSLRLMMLGQGGFGLPVATILNSGAVFEGGGGLF